MSQLPQRDQLKVVAEKAILAGVILPGQYVDAEDPFCELRELAGTAGAEVVGELLQKRNRPRARTYLGGRCCRRPQADRLRQRGP